MVEYINRKKKKYYLHEGKTKLGKPKYYFSTNPEGNLIDTIPDSYEICENPQDAGVYLRKRIQKLITDKEIGIVEKYVSKYVKKNEYKIDVKKGCIVIYLDEEKESRISDMLEIAVLYTSDRSLEKISEIVEKSSIYMPMMRFVLKDKDKRIFEVERWCFSGRIDGWLSIYDSDNLDNLARKYCKHLGKESFYELV